MGAIGAEFAPPIQRDGGHDRYGDFEVRITSPGTKGWIASALRASQ
jgi:hypothetical protein